MKQLVIHFSGNHHEGDYTRIKKLQKDISKIVKSKIYEVEIIKITDVVKVLINKYRKNKISNCGFRIVLPILLPGMRKLFVRRVNASISNLAGAILGLFITPDICIGETHNSYHVISAIKKIHKKCHVCIDLHGAYPEETYYSHCSQAKISSIVQLLDHYERKLINGVDIVICQSEAMRKHLCAKHKVQPQKFLVYQCGVNMLKFSHDEKLGSLARKTLNISKDDYVFVYLGGLHSWQLIDDVFLIYKKISIIVENTKLLVITSGPLKTVCDKASNYGVDIVNLRVLSVPHHKVPMYLSACDFGFLLREDTLLNQVACPTKLGEYLACGVPVITSSIGNTWNWTSGSTDQICIVDYSNPDRASQQIFNFLKKTTTSKDKENIKSSCRELAQKKLSAQSDTNNLFKHFGKLT